MAFILMLTAIGKKSFKGKSIVEIAKSFWILDIFLSLTDGEWTISAELFNQGHGCVIQYSPSLVLETLCGWGGLGVPTEYLVAPVLNWIGLGCDNSLFYIRCVISLFSL